MADELASLTEALHDSEINGEIGWFYDDVWRAKLGDPWNGYRAEKDGFLSLGQAAGGSATKRSTITPIATLPENTYGRIPAISRNTRQGLADRVVQAFRLLMPEPTGGRNVDSLKCSASICCFGRTGMIARISGNSRSPIPVRS